MCRSVVNCVAVQYSSFQCLARDTCLGVLQMLRNVLQGVTGGLHYMVGVMLCVAVCCILLRCVAMCCSPVQCTVVCCSALRCVAVCCSVLRCVAVCYSELQMCFCVLRCVVVRYSV